MAQKTGLGKGLDALIPAGLNTTPTRADSYAPVSMIIPNPQQPRDTISPESLAELSSSIREHGVLQPLVVSHDPVTGMYTLIAGERRLRAAKIAGLEKVPIIIRTVSEQQRLTQALIENIQRADLSPLETARGFRRLIDEFNLTHETLADQVGKSRVTVTNTLRLLNLPAEAQEALAASRISEGHARALLGLPTPQAQLSALHTVLSQQLNVRQTEELVRKLTGIKPRSLPPVEVDPHFQELEERLRVKLGTRVTLRSGKKGGTITIHYYSDEELNGLIEKLT
ncbi:MAG TPA: ParB/RepB/Spo0J family partition protein [Anaerolineaceae bacterium]|jgi:ParB family chromosome partitioning protein|nr:ParB/RepB/Spo0J family partition protein [Anaerolineaceae bacterium]NMC18101.1 ParB/RepB/Spo0J family partition protein [Chloroflexota bacterium]HNS08007.1 ParB/RepB/Spo0J family partition protein [Anaerolineaceae bacterium]HNW14486.1 ParB/RepB/Spo0J family partition protein [Anaerolineaceae bacterium]HOE03195.1 ParB/RepB/Spo0J family partition protein [Anaerolineaceae bacterium]